MVTFSNYTKNEILTIESVKDSLLNKETKRKEKNESYFGVLVHEKTRKIRKTKKA